MVDFPKDKLESLQNYHQLWAECKNIKTAEIDEEKLNAAILEYFSMKLESESIELKLLHYCENISDDLTSIMYK